jgi:putative membrane protein
MRMLAAAVSAFLLALVPIAVGAQDLTPEGRGAYLAVAGANNLYMVKAAEIAREKARRPEVRQFAEAVLAEHNRNIEQLLEAARTGGLETFPPAMMPMHWDMLRRLERTSGARFDGLYVDQQIQALEAALELHRNFFSNGNGTQLKAFAQAAWPKASEQLEQARQLEN